jgi:aminocarboxymuconate-semialdehyde decarboxylase
MAIDIHTHVVPFDFPPCAGGAAPDKWPQMASAPNCRHRNVMIDGKVFRTVTDECWDVARRLEHKASIGITRQVLSPMPELLSYWLPAGDAVTLCRHVNDTIVAMVEQAPEKFAALGCVPLENVDLAVRELELLMTSGRFRGVEIGTNVNGVALGDNRFLPFFEAAEALNASIFVHPLHPTGIDRLVGPAALVQLLAFPGETALSVASLITGGVLERYRQLRIAVSHGGGGFALTLPRLMFGWSHVGLAPGGRTPLEQARSLYYDTLVYDAPTLRHLIETFGRTQLCIGTDHPFVIQERAPVQRIDDLGVDDILRELLFSGNARRFLGESN